MPKSLPILTFFRDTFQITSAKYSHRKENFNFGLEKEWHILLYDEKGLGKEETRDVMKKILSIFFCAFGRCLPRILGHWNSKKARDRISFPNKPTSPFSSIVVQESWKEQGKWSRIFKRFPSFHFYNFIDFFITKFIKKASNSINLQQAKQTTK
jgi:hypothetical protein